MKQIENEPSEPLVGSRALFCSEAADWRTRGEIAVRVRFFRPDSGLNPDEPYVLLRWPGPVLTSERVDAALRVVLQAAGGRTRVGSIQFTGFGRQIYVSKGSFVA